MNNDNKDNEDENFYNISKAFYEINIPVHIEYKNGGWHNGMIIEIRADFFLLDEFEDGLLPVFYNTVSKIIKYIPKEAKEDGSGKKPST